MPGQVLLVVICSAQATRVVYPLVVSLSSFHPIISTWFRRRFGDPTPPQARGWPLIQKDQHTLIAAPTGSGKTLAAFLASLDRLVRLSLAGQLKDQVEVLYVSPLKALSSDVRKNLEEPLRELHEEARAQGLLLQPIRVGLRTGDTPPAERQAMAKRPPHILVTTPESLYLCLTSTRPRQGLSAVRTVIVDEIHALVRDKRGAHLSLSLERLDTLCRQAGSKPPCRIGLSATQKPIEEVARFLVGSAQVAADGTPECHILDGGHRRKMDLRVLTPKEEMQAVCSNNQWADVHDQLAALIREHRTTLVFVSTRRLAERTAHSLVERLGNEAVTAHHGSMSRRLRHSVEDRLRRGELKAVVATASLELGIDIGAVDLVCQVGSPRAIATLLQRVGRANHRPEGASQGSPGRDAGPAAQQSSLPFDPAPQAPRFIDPAPQAPRVDEVSLLPPKGRLFALTRDELVECAALLRAVQMGEFDRVLQPVCPVDVLAQQICALCAVEEWREDDLFALCQRAWPFRGLTRERFDQVVSMLADGVSTRRGRRGAHLHRDQVGGTLTGRRGARLFAVLNGGTIPEPNDYDVIAEPAGVSVGKLDEDWVVESSAGDIFLLGSTSWRIRAVHGGQVFVTDAQGAPPTVPFWAGEAPGRTFELSQAVSALRVEIDERLGFLEKPPREAAERVTHTDALVAWLAQEGGLSREAAAQMVSYLAAGRGALGCVPSQHTLVAERFFDEGGGMQLVLHMPLGARINRAFGLALRKRFCRSFNFELQAAATDDGVLLSLGETHSFPLESVWQFLNSGSVEQVLTQAVLGAPVFGPHFRWTAMRALAMPRRRGGKKVPPPISRIYSEDLLAAVFPNQAACPENLPGGDIEIPDHPLVNETLRECLHDVMDLPGLRAVLQDIEAGRVQVRACDTPEPSVFSHQILNAAPYAFLDDTPLEERRSRAVSLRRGLPAEIAQKSGAQLDPQAIATVWDEAWPAIRDADELHDALLTLGYLPEGRPLPRPGRPGPQGAVAAEEELRSLLPFLREKRRVTRMVASAAPGTQGTATFSAWVATERVDLSRRIFADAVFAPEVPAIPWKTAGEAGAEEAATEVVRGWLASTGPWSAAGLSAYLTIPVDLIDAALLRLESEGQVLRGRFTAASRCSIDPGNPGEHLEWCDRRLLARIHRLTIGRLRREIDPVSPAVLTQFLARWQHVAPGTQLAGPTGLLHVLQQLQGFEAPAGAWEEDLLRQRLSGYDPMWLDELCLSGELAWGRLRPPQGEGEVRRGPTRAAPITLWLREGASWLLWGKQAESTELPGLSGPRMGPLAAAILTLLSRRGALFLTEICAAAGRPQGEVAEALGELVSAGRCTADGFAGLRNLIGKGRTGGARASAGRWSLLTMPTREALIGAENEPDAPQKDAQPEPIEAWTRLYLRRYGVVLREVLMRENGPTYREVLPVLRTLEARGEIRGGRFVSGLSGEQFALPEAIESLRALRRHLEEAARDEVLDIGAADPLNLSGLHIHGPGPGPGKSPGQRVPATCGARVRFLGGVPQTAGLPGEAKEETSAASVAS